MDWIEESQRFLTIQENCSPEPLPSLDLVYFYISKDNSVSTVEKESLDLGKSSNRVITKERILELVHRHKKSTTHTQFILKDTCLFHIDLDSDKIASFDESSYNTYWRSFPIVDSICLQVNLFLFHAFSTLDFFYYEEDKPSMKSLKSALKMGSSSRNNHHMTKRVRWNTNDTHSTSKSFKSTRKRL